MAGGKRERYFRLTDEANEGLDALATRHGTTKTTLIEALGVLSRRRDPTIADIVDLARQLDRDRRSRR